MGRAMFGSLAGSGESSAPASAPAVSENPCASAQKAFEQCVSKNADDVGRCQTFADLLLACKRG